MCPGAGFASALDAGAEEVAIVAAASEAFSQHTMQCGIAESLANLRPLLRAARGADVAMRGYVSCAVGCPFQVPLILGWQHAVYATLKITIHRSMSVAWGPSPMAGHQRYGLSCHNIAPCAIPNVPSIIRLTRGVLPHCHIALFHVIPCHDSCMLAMPQTGGKARRAWLLLSVKMTARLIASTALKETSMH